jgi:predicted kinase
MPWLIALMGLPGAGKSTLAARLVETLPAVLVDRDAVRKTLFPRGEVDDAARHRANEAVLAEAEEHLAARRSVVLDGMTLARQADRQRFRSLAARSRAMFLPVFLDCPVETAVERVRADRLAGRHPAADRDERLVPVVANRFDPLPEDVLTLDATGPAEAMADAVRDFVRAVECR